MIKKGDRVAIEYEGRFEDGTVFDSSSHGDHVHPLVFVVGAHQVIQGFDEAAVGLKEGDTKTFTLRPEEAYGEYQSNLTREVSRAEFTLPPHIVPKEGTTLIVRTPQGFDMPVRITKITDSHFTLDLNHPLAGKTLIFSIKVAGINGTIKDDAAHTLHQ